MSLEAEFKPILDREKHKNDFSEHFSGIESLLKDIVNYGTNLIPRCFQSSKRNLEDIIIIGTLLKQVVSMLDGSEVLISNGALHSSNLQARSLLEASLYIDWILKSDTDMRARYYYVSNLREDRFWALRSAGKSPDQVAFDKIVKDMGLEFDIEPDEMKREAKKQIDEIDRVLSLPPFKDINIHFQTYRNKRRLNYEPFWYSPLGIKSIRMMADKVERLPEYMFFYSLASHVMHSSRYRHHIIIGNGKITFEPIRCLVGIEILINFIVSFTLKCYRTILNHYRPDEIPAFNRKYIEDWRDDFRNLKSVAYIPESDNITI